MAFADAPGAATLARQVTTEGEVLLWAAHGREFAFDVAGHDAAGQPHGHAVPRGFGAFGMGAATMAVGMAMGTDLPGEGAVPPAVVVFGADGDCRARTLLTGVEPRGGTPWRTWALTSARLLVLDVRPPSTGEPRTPLLRRTLERGRDLVHVLTDRTRRYGPNTEGVAVARKPMTVVAATGREHLHDVAVARRRLRMRTRPCLRLSFVDGSGLDLLLGVEDESVFEWMAELSGEGR
ncbi:hypothetical protein B1813_14990 [Saccharomonospora piscinae]|uniref:Uncharacterized protein n=1 Tax=Saccharomonospora piscinae TaxID=687388 RepID=A0A1V9A190_SACPI|nr:hypothetical protein [Saccharomonospora piscinae]OQO90830.1 hypothetical protein B1813_14990 [Saccharomonospora piscinae]TLW93503.1 hypothetical protein FFT09_08925 [Saccharomonospora piscinae]